MIRFERRERGRIVPTELPRTTLRSGSALVAVMWSVVLLGSVVVGLLHTTTLELRIAKNFGDRCQAHYLALAGIEKAKAMIDLEIEERKTNGTNYRSKLRDDASAFRDVKLGRGIYRVYRTGDRGDDQGRLIYGLSDEESRININTIDLGQLDKLPGFTSATAAAITDWRDFDQEPSEEGAEQPVYAEQPVPYLVRNGPIETLRELLFVRGVRPELLLGEDQNANGVLDPEEQDGAASAPMDNGDAILDRGWSQYLATESAARNVSAKDERRLNINFATQDELAALPDISDDLAKSIVEFRESNQFSSIIDLLNVRRMQQRNDNNARREGGNETDGGDGGRQSQNLEATGDPLIDRELLKKIADDVTTNFGVTQAGVVNVNSASARVLSMLPGIDDELAQAIVQHRRQNQHFPTIAHLLDVRGMDQDKLKELANSLTTRSDTWRVFSEGFVPSTGARKRIEVIIRMGTFGVDTLYYREDL